MAVLPGWSVLHRVRGTSAIPSSTAAESGGASTTTSSTRPVVDSARTVVCMARVGAPSQVTVIGLMACPLLPGVVLPALRAARFVG